MLPNSLYKQVENFLDAELREVNNVTGGSINQAAKIETADNQTLFLKWNDSAPDDTFLKEKKGLELLAEAETGLKIPAVIATSSTDDEVGFLLIQFIQKGCSNTDSAEKFGRLLARLHKNTADQYGLDYNNYIGRLPQKNSWHENWIDFFVMKRLDPQLKQAVDQRLLTAAISENFRRLYKKLPALLPDEPPSLLHGDLWSGNYFFDAEGEAVIYDPAVYYGNREIELAFTHLFGGFSSEFYESYQRAFPLKAGFAERKDIYNLYPLLVHTNMFGESYAAQVEDIIQQF